MRNKILLLAFLAILGIYFVHQGVTGLVISETCCVGTSCTENACNFDVKSAGDIFSITAGLVLVFIAVLYINKHLK